MKALAAREAAAQGPDSGFLGMRLQQLGPQVRPASPALFVRLFPLYRTSAAAVAHNDASRTHVSPRPLVTCSCLCASLHFVQQIMGYQDVSYLTNKMCHWSTLSLEHT